MRQIVQTLKEPKHRLAFLIAAATGLRRSEIRGLKWRDVDSEKRWLHLRRGIVRTLETRLKTEGSRRGIPISDDLLAALDGWRNQTPFPGDDDWVVPGESGRCPLWLDMVMADHIRPAAVKAGITKRIAWHTLRRSLASLLAAKGESIKVTQELLRHSSPTLTQGLYQQADADQKRAALEHVKGLFLVETMAS
jgi:integrase